MRASNQLVIQAVKLQADQTAIRRSSVSPAPRGDEVLHQQVRELRDGQDVDQIEKELDRLDPGLPVATRAQQEPAPLAADEWRMLAHARRSCIAAVVAPVTRPPS